MAMWQAKRNIVQVAAEAADITFREAQIALFSAFSEMCLSAGDFRFAAKALREQGNEDGAILFEAAADAIIKAGRIKF